MADKIVQLIDKSGDNIFPLSSDPNAAKITMTTSDPGEGAALDQNNFVAVYGGDPIIMDYSTSEINTGAKWIDGSTIYKKTINLGYLPNDTTENVAHGISNLSDVVQLETIAYNGTYWRPLPFHDASPMAVFVSDSYISVYTTWDASHWTGYSTIYYTKSS